jgi:thiosulfate/3-mercaptopyruvate sulfurtransferase
MSGAFKAGLKDGSTNVRKLSMRDRNAIISTEALAALLGQPNLRVYDCTTYNNPPPPGVDEPYIPEPGLATFREAHIPGADYLDLQGEFSDKSQRYWFMMPKDLAQLEVAFARRVRGFACGPLQYRQHDVVNPHWWMLRSLGLDDVAVLDGGFDKWKAEGRMMECGDSKGYPTATFKARLRPGLFVNKFETMAAIGAPGTVIVNALGPQFHRGLEPSRYGRPGRVPGGVNVPAANLVNPKTKDFVTLAEALAIFEANGVTKEKKVICYCGGGISATVDLFLMYQLGYDNLTLYDGSMGEWAKDPELPIETD